jgi:hypothetical protein
VSQNISRAGFVAGLALVVAAPVAAVASVQDDKRKFAAQCDESISIDRLAGAPYKFVGKKVDLHGVVGPATDPDIINLNSENGNGVFVVVVASSRSLEQGQHVRVLGTVANPVSGPNNSGGNGTYAVVRKAFLE